MAVNKCGQCLALEERVRERRLTLRIQRKPRILQCTNPAPSPSPRKRGEGNPQESVVVVPRCAPRAAGQHASSPEQPVKATGIFRHVAYLEQDEGIGGTVRSPEGIPML